jgi:Asp-tRNA(Asn)/Glu-tRNA(Gln) amidotransferase A subunit family amidase
MPITSLNTHNRRELMQASLAIARDSSSVFTHLYVDAALAAAAHADVLRVTGQHSSALAGLSVSVKDLFDVAGETTLAGSIALRDAPPAASDAVVVARLRAAGADRVRLLGRGHQPASRHTGQPG